MQKKHSGFQNWEKIKEFVSLDVEQKNQSWETVLVTKLGLCKQKNKNPKTIFQQKQKHDMIFILYF